jgi:hypothetical protein
VIKILDTNLITALAGALGQIRRSRSKESEFFKLFSDASRVELRKYFAY